jgi:hypothetical protein
MDPHALAEARSLALHREVLARIERNPELLVGIRARLDAWRADPSKPRAYVAAWTQLLDGPFADLRATLTGTDERSTALRQATPFAGVVDARTRWRIWEAVKTQFAESA